jgi:hypothetical protein
VPINRLCAAGVCFGRGSRCDNCGAAHQSVVVFLEFDVDRIPCRGMGRLPEGIPVGPLHLFRLCLACNKYGYVCYGSGFFWMALLAAHSLSRTDPLLRERVLAVRCAALAASWTAIGHRGLAGFCEEMQQVGPFALPAFVIYIPSLFSGFIRDDYCGTTLLYNTGQGAINGIRSGVAYAVESPEAGLAAFDAPAAYVVYQEGKAAYLGQCH